MLIGDDLDLVPGAGDVLPVRVRWVRLVGNTGAVAIDSDRVYVASGVLAAFALADGSVVWEAKHPEGYALHDSGGVVLGLDGPQVVRAFAPWEYELRVERATGRRISYRELVGGVLPVDLVALPIPPPTRFRVEAGLDEIVASGLTVGSPGGWWLRVPSSMPFPRSRPTAPSSVPQAPAIWLCWILSTLDTASDCSSGDRRHAVPFACQGVGPDRLCEPRVAGPVAGHRGALA